MGIKSTGLISGLDTESIIKELVAAKSTKKETMVKEQTKLGWKQDAWKTLNSKIYSLYSSTLSNMQYEGSYKKLATSITDSSVADIITGTSAVAGTQTLQVSSLAKTGYLTGAKIQESDSTAVSSTSKLVGDLGITAGTTFTIKGTSTQTVTIDSTTTMSSLLTTLKSAGVNASFDETNQRLFISSASSGASNDFSITAAGAVGSTENTNSTDALTKLGLTVASGANRVTGTDATIVLNGASFTSANNTFSINGLTITAKTETGTDTETITTAQDTSGIYSMIKNFLTEYNKVVNEMDKLYNADSASKYQPLTDDEKDTMSDTEVEKWETKIKDALLRKDNSLDTISSAMKTIMSDGATMDDGSKMYFSEFGISTASYFSAAENEKNAYHIDGDSTDSVTSGNTDKLKTAIANDPDKVTEFFTTLAKTLYKKITSITTGTDYRHAYKAYDDKLMETEYKQYTSDIADQEDLIADYEDRYYDKFAAMETALSKLQSQQSSLTNLFS